MGQLTDGNENASASWKAAWRNFMRWWQRPTESSTRFWRVRRWKRLVRVASWCDREGHRALTEAHALEALIWGDDE